MDFYCELSLESPAHSAVDVKTHNWRILDCTDLSECLQSFVKLGSFKGCLLTLIKDVCIYGSVSQQRTAFFFHPGSGCQR